MATNMFLTKQRQPSAARQYPPAVFGQLTDILAEIFIEDLQRHPQIPMSVGIDRPVRRDNTSLPPPRGSA